MSIYRPKRSPFYHFDFEIEGYRFSGSTKCRDERDAQAVEAARKIEARQLVERLTAEGREPVRFGAAAERWWNEHGSTLADRKSKSVLDRLVEIIGPKTFLHAISDDDVSRLVAERRKDTRRDSTAEDGTILYRPVTPTTVNRTLDQLRRVMRRARDNWNAAILREPKWGKHRLAEKKRHVREISQAEEQALDQAEAFDFAELRRFAIITGLRRRDVLLRWPQVDFELGIIRVITKGGIPRVIPLTHEAYAMLWRRRGHHPEFVFTYQARRTWKDRKRLGRALPDLIKGQRYPITESAFASNKARKWKAAGVDARIHDLRHTTGMRTMRKTGNLKVVQKLLGHSDIAVTAKFYTDATVEDLREAMETTSAQTIDHDGGPALERPAHKKGEAQ